MARPCQMVLSDRVSRCSHPVADGRRDCGRHRAQPAQPAQLREPQSGVLIAEADPLAVTAPAVASPCVAAAEPYTPGDPPSRTDRLYGRGFDALFTGAPKTVLPFPRKAKSKTQPRVYDQDLVRDTLNRPPTLTEVDPRRLLCSQPMVTADGVRYYLTDEWPVTGRTYADQEQRANRFPVVYVNDAGQHIILTGHHRATAALLRGEALPAIVVREPQAAAA